MIEELLVGLVSASTTWYGLRWIDKEVKVYDSDWDTLPSGVRPFCRCSSCDSIREAERDKWLSQTLNQALEDEAVTPAGDERPTPAGDAPPVKPHPRFD